MLGGLLECLNVKLTLQLALPIRMSLLQEPFKQHSDYITDYEKERGREKYTEEDRWKEGGR